MRCICPFSSHVNCRPPRSASSLLFHAALWTTSLLCTAGSLAADPPAVAVYEDPQFDAIARPTDPGLGALFDPDAHSLIDLLEITIGRWNPSNPDEDLFSGEYLQASKFVRIDLTFAGLVNPPGSTDAEHFSPFKYGSNPAYGFLEIDVDVDNSTGGEIDAPQLRFLANIARFGGLPPNPVFDNRLALRGATDLDKDFDTMPFVERHGEEFHLALLGDQFSSNDIQEVTGNNDGVFEAGESWVLRGRWFHRAHGFEQYSFAYGGPHAGEYNPDCRLRFQHHPQTNTTVLTLIAALNNVGAAEMVGEPPQPRDHDTSNHASVLEGLYDLRDSAIAVALASGSDSEEAIILGWKDKTPNLHIRAEEWRITALFGTSYCEPEYDFVWTDTFPNVIRGDVDRSGTADSYDVEAINSFIVNNDSSDSSLDSSVVLSRFAADFSVYDLDQTGSVDANDLLFVSEIGDCDLDGDVDLLDGAVWQACFGRIAGDVQCSLADLNGTGTVDLADFHRLTETLAGPSLPQDPQ